MMLHTGILLWCVGSLTPQIGPAGAVTVVGTDSIEKSIVQTNTEKIPYEVVFRIDRNLRNGQLKRVQVGQQGSITKRYKVTFKDGKKVGAQLLSTMSTPAKDEVYIVGDRNRLATRGDFTRSKTLVMNSSAYCAQEFAGSSRNPFATATGAKAIRGVAAVDPRVIPLKTVLYIEGYGLAIAGDTGGGIKGHKIDLCMNSISEMNKWGRRSVRVHILGR